MSGSSNLTPVMGISDVDSDHLKSRVGNVNIVAEKS